ncbi:MAG: 1,4-alpha-glucan branching protein GlgB [Planctomycetaceae bacterium]|nr:1,4-alpha-glucan branching protein GlgB [Planctomycetaceae bacterium]
MLSDFDLHLFNEGAHDRLYEKLGAHPLKLNGSSGTHFATWAPNAREVSVIGDFNGWNPRTNPLSRRASGVWSGFVPAIGHGARYKYSIVAPDGGSRFDKADPFAFAAEVPPGTASKVWDLSDFTWGDADWVALRAARQSLTAPIAIYELHLGSWMRDPEDTYRPLTYREIAPMLADYVADMGYTHVELMPVADHPTRKSWGYQMVGYYAASGWYGTPQDLMSLIDTLHRRGIGVFVDWVPAHFATDPHGLAEFDGSHLYEPVDRRKRRIPLWNTFAFNYESPQVVNFLLTNALFWLDKYHVDGLRVDGIEAMIRLDFGREPGEWAPNKFGGVENLEAVSFLQRFNRKVHEAYPGVLTIAEDATPRPNITRPVGIGGMGFDLKWDLGWVYDTLNHYMTLDPPRRHEAYTKLLFRMHYAFNENYLLPLSHDEVAKGKGSFLARMPGDDWQKRAHLRLLLGYMYVLPGKKLIFMGGDFGQWQEWDYATSIDWHLLHDLRHRSLQRWVRDLNTQYRAEPALHEFDCRPEGFEWVDAKGAEWGVLCFLRKGSSEGDLALVVVNFMPDVLRNYRVGVPRAGRWEEILNSDAEIYGGSGQGNLGGVKTSPISWHGRPQSLNLTLPPLGIIVMKQAGR